VLRPERPAPPPAAPSANPAGSGVLRIEPVRVAPLFERTGFVYRTGERAFETDFYARFAAPPGVLVRDALAEWLAGARLFADVQRGGDRSRARWWLEGRVEALYADLRDPAAPTAVVELELALVDARSPALATRLRERYRAEVPTSADPAALAEAWSQGLAQAFAELEDDLRGVLAAEVADQAD
jgi:uncharacterized lipoprotein YmbA